MSSSNQSLDRRSSTIALVSVSVFTLVCGMIVAGGLAYQKFFAALDKSRWRNERSFVCWNGEIFFSEQKVNLISGPGGASLMLAINPKTGVVRDTGIKLHDAVLGCVTNGETLWIVGRDEIVELNKNLVEHHKVKRALNPLAAPFLLDDQLGILAKDDAGKDYLYQFDNGDLKNAGQVVLPGTGRKWSKPTVGNPSRLIPRTAEDGVSKVGGWEMVRAVQVGRDVHVIAVTFGGSTASAAYRIGLDFVGDETDTVSALVPANDDPDTMGWSLLDTNRFSFQTIPCNLRGELRLAAAGEPQLWKPDPAEPGKFQRTITRMFNSSRGALPPYMAIAQSPDETYWIGVSGMQTVKFFRLKETDFEPLTITLPGIAQAMIAQESVVVALIIAVFVLANLILLIGSAWLAGRQQTDQYTFGHETILLASLSRRWVARFVDLSIALAPLTMTSVWTVRACESEDLFVLQGSLFRDIASARFGSIGAELGSALNRFSNAVHALILIGLLASISWGVLYVVISTIAQGRSGKTFGKWLCGIRVVRSTLRPCGITRSLVRELLLCVDTLNLTIVVPGVASILMTDARQRLGDLVADTIVVDSRR